MLLAVSVAIVMTGFGIVLPVFARRLGELDEGVGTLGLMTMAFALAQFLAAPPFGALADRIGRRPLILLALAAYAGANVAFLFVDTAGGYIGVRAAQGALTAGLFPAAIGVVADLVDDAQRAQYVGIVMGAYGAGLVLGPVLGGVLYDGFGFESVFIVSAALATVALVAAAKLVPETRTRAVRVRERLRARRDVALGASGSLLDSLPRPVLVFTSLLAIDFALVFAFAFIEPQMVFYVYDDLGWTTAQFGIVVGSYGLAMMIGQVGLGGLSDTIGRKPVIVIGVLLSGLLYVGMATLDSFPLFVAIALVAGLGKALTSPALSAAYLDITAEQYRSRIVGIKSSAASLGGVAGPLLVIVAADLTSAKGVFVIAGIVTLATAAVAAVALRGLGREAIEPPGLAWQASEARALAAYGVLQGLAVNARAARITAAKT